MVTSSASVLTDDVMRSAGGADYLYEFSFVGQEIDSDGGSSDSYVYQIAFSYKPHDVFDDIDFRAAGHFRERTVCDDAVMIFFDDRVVDPALRDPVHKERAPDDYPDLH